MLDQEAATSHLLHSVQTATVPGCTTPEAIGVAAENLSAALIERCLLCDDAAYETCNTCGHDYCGRHSKDHACEPKPAKTFIPFGI